MDAPASSVATPPPPASGYPVESAAPRRRSGGQKRKSLNSSSSTPSKRLMKERYARNIPSSSPLHRGPVTRARQSPSKLAARPPVAVPRPEAHDEGKDSGVPIGAEEEEELVFFDEPIVDTEFDAVRSRGSDVHVVPVPAGWFCWEDVHPIEKQALASFFNGKLESRTPEIYLEIRNSVMKKFHADPQTQLEVKDLSEISVGDTKARQEVIEFLAHWGLINFHPFPPSNSEVSNWDTGEHKTSSSLVDKLYKFEKVQPCPRIVAKKVGASGPAEMPKLLPESALTELLVGPVGPSVEYHCNSCSADCSSKRYHCQKQADFDLCAECYNNGKFGSGMAPADFILMKPAEVPGVSCASWTDQETLLLLEALELFPENWNEVAEHVATKTKAQCILHFLQMPIEDPFLFGNVDAGDEVQEQVDCSSASKETNVSCVHKTKEVDNAVCGDQPNSSTTDVSAKTETSKLEFSCENGSSLPIDALKAAFQAIGLTPEQGLPSFAEAGNPVMALAAFLSRLVEPDVAATSLRSSLKAMSEDSPGIQLATRHCFILENPPNAVKDLPASDSAATDMGIGEAPKEEDQMPTSNGTNKLKVPNDADEPKPSNGIEELKPSIGSDELNPSNGSDEPKPLNDNDELKPSNGCGEPNPKNNNNELKSSNDTDEFKTFSGNDELKTSNGSDKVKTSNGNDELKPSNVSDELKTFNGSNELKPSNGSDESNNCPNKSEEGAVSVENETKVSVSSQDCLQKTPDAKESGDSDSQLQAAPTSTKESDIFSLKGEQISSYAMKDTNDAPGSPMIHSSTNSRVSGDLTFQGVVAPDAVGETIVLEAAREDKSDSVKMSSKLASLEEIEAISVTSLVVDTKPTLALPEEPDSQQQVGTDSIFDSTQTADGYDKKVSPSNSGKNQNLQETKGDHKINKLKRAAATGLSAAAVKAKLLANQEEDQIRQLVSMVIEKQLHKLDAKLAIFAEIESVIMREREQTEKARQRLIQDRAQMIADRFGLPATSARANPMSLTTGKIAVDYATAGSKPPAKASHPMRKP